MWDKIKSEMNFNQQNMDGLMYINDLACIIELNKTEKNNVLKNLKNIKKKENAIFEFEFEENEEYERLVIDQNNSEELIAALAFINRRYLQNDDEQILYVHDSEEDNNKYIYLI